MFLLSSPSLDTAVDDVAAGGPLALVDMGIGCDGSLSPETLVDAHKAEHVTREPGQKLVVFGDFHHVLPPPPLPAAVTDGTLPVGDRGAHHVRAMMVVTKASALAAIPLRAGTYAGLIAHARAGPRGDKPLPAADVLEFFAVGLKEAATPPDVIRDAAGDD
jgi:hypothetical protein